MGIKAIETKYQGCRFRSRLEARWAVFFDNMRTDWRYELEGFDINGHWYLPDFWVPWPHTMNHPAAGCWVEIKPIDLDDSQIDTLAALAKESGDHVFAICGEPWSGKHKVYWFKHHRYGTPSPIYRSGSFAEVENSTEYDLWHEIIVESDGECIPSILDIDSTRWTDGEALSRAFAAARSARF